MERFTERQTRRWQDDLLGDVEVTISVTRCYNTAAPDETPYEARRKWGRAATLTLAAVTSNMIIRDGGTLEPTEEPEPPQQTTRGDSL